MVTHKHRIPLSIKTRDFVKVSSCQDFCLVEMSRIYYYGLPTVLFQHLDSNSRSILAQLRTNSALTQAKFSLTENFVQNFRIFLSLATKFA